MHGESTITCPVPETVADAAGTTAAPSPETQVLTNKALARLVAGHCPGTFPDKGPQKRRDRCRKSFTQNDLRSHRRRVSRLSVRQRCRTNPCTGGVFADFQRQGALRPHDHPASMPGLLAAKAGNGRKRPSVTSLPNENGIQNQDTAVRLFSSPPPAPLPSTGEGSWGKEYGVQSAECRVRSRQHNFKRKDLAGTAGGEFGRREEMARPGKDAVRQNGTRRNHANGG